jgi:hypothetical protein
MPPTCIYLVLQVELDMKQDCKFHGMRAMFYKELPSVNRNVFQVKNFEHHSN